MRMKSGLPIEWEKMLGILLLAVTLMSTASPVLAHEKPRLVVTTDISNEPDDEESLVRLLVYSNEFDIEGLIATTSTWLKNTPREDLIRRDIGAYAKVRDHLLIHAPGFPLPDQLLAGTKTGQPGYGMAFVGKGKSSTGSQRLIEVVDRPDPRPVWVTIWGGANTLAQALSDVRDSRSALEVDKFVAKLRVYSISDQDDAGPWIRREFPNLFYIVSPSNPGSTEYYRATWVGISGDRQYKIGLHDHFDMVDNPWLEKNIIHDHGPLGELYPPLKYIMEGDTPSFLGLIDNGLGWDVSPANGGWGGRYVHFQVYGETHPIWTNNANSRDTVTADNGSTETSDSATIWRWREAYQNDFAARMNWCVADDFKKANHNPIVVVNGDQTTDILKLSAKGGDTISLSAEGTRDPDGNTVQLKWWIYEEAGNIRGASLSQSEGTKTDVHLPEVKTPGELHVILQAEDDGTPRLFAYRRIVIEAAP
jgi:hypothetical protein